MQVANKVLNNQDRDGMLKRSLERIIQLYTDKAHFVYELLQNAEDSGAHSIRFVQYQDRLEVMHDGHAFTIENLQGLCDIGLSDKTNDLNQIGEFGVGFKSVFGICETVKLYSSPTKDMFAEDCQPFAIEIKDFTKPVDIEPISIPHRYTTLFIFPYSVGHKYSGFNAIDTLNGVLSERLKDLGVTTLLFMNNLNLIEYEIQIPGKELSGQYLLDKQPLNDHCTRVSAIEMEGENTDETLSFIKFCMPVDCTVSNRTVDIAFSLITDKDGVTSFEKTKNPFISVYFPTETESKLDFIVQGPFRTTPNRSSVPANEDENIALAKQCAQLLRRSIIELRDMGMLDLSLIKILPIDKNRFDVYPLFKPLYEATHELLLNEEILPDKDEKGYVKASNALIARSKGLVEIFPDDLISELYDTGNGKHYKWLPLSVTENGPFREIYTFFANKLKIRVVRPEDLRSHFNRNRSFLEKRDDKWLVQLYKFYETIPSIFDESNKNILDAVMIKTEANHIVAPYRKTDSGYIPNVFLPTKSSENELLVDVEIVNHVLYEQCKSFFEKRLLLKVPDEYEFFIKSLKKRYDSINQEIPEEEYIQDIKAVVRFLNMPNYSSDMRNILKKSFYLKCRKGNSSILIKPFKQRVLFPKSESGLMLEEYYKGVSDDVVFVDFDIYQSAGISYSDLRLLDVTDNILTGEDFTFGEYLPGIRGGRRYWLASGDFRWKFNIDKIEDVLLYISKNPQDISSMVKSQTIFKILQQNQHKLVGDFSISDRRDYFHFERDQRAKIVNILRNDEDSSKLEQWDGRWVYTESKQLVSHMSISKHDLSTELYGNVSLDSNLYDILGFKKGKIDLYEAVVKDYNKIPEEKRKTYFELELKRLFEITPQQLKQMIENGRQQATSPIAQGAEVYEFPVGKIKNWDALKKHAAQILAYASPVSYQMVVRSIRVSKSEEDVRAYLKNMYRVNYSNRYACQLCHQPNSNVEMCQLEKKPDMELDPMNLCLCRNCAQQFRAFRNDNYNSKQLIKSLLYLSENDIIGSDHVSVCVGRYDFWFTQTHAAEIVELLRLKDDVRRVQETKSACESDSVQNTSYSRPKTESVVTPQNAMECSATDVTEEADAKNVSQHAPDPYKEFIGHRIYHKKEKRYAKVTGFKDNFILLNFETGKNANQEIRYYFDMCMDNGWIELVDD